MIDTKQPPPSSAAPGDAKERRALQPLHIPIRALGPTHREQILEHLLSLTERDRYLRFGYPASDAQVRRYVEGLDFQRDEIYGIHNRKLELIAMAHLAFDPPTPGKPRAAEFGVSVLSKYRGRSLGAKLYDRAMMHARNEGVEIMYIHALSENAPMLKIARNAGATVHREGSESEAYLKLPKPNLNSRLTEAFEDQIGEIDYRMKVQAYQFQSFLDNLWGMGMHRRPEARPAPEQEPDAAPPAQKQD
ncbi:GNAT family N-acetyltransferase [Vandammella animalimorsus]|uniref:GNAT family N-acetyltransferase n=1 Tax=Vandammella animalimorsus TaxID=2029117 RepID=A0A3M6RJI5_9BURK|nr:GNAT family N-acetyltransferase [Vandammella animalimorsus]RMX15028.1 GNAT family N-acetyltransferase [Vandammella animalimorsus]